MTHGQLISVAKQSVDPAPCLGGDFGSLDMMTFLRQQIEHNQLLNAALLQMRDRVEELEKLVDSDTLTPLYNRRRFVRDLQLVVDPANGTGVTASVMFIDMDGLKAINDHHGHHAGDAALIEVAQLLLRCCRPVDVVARIGGDEFAILMAGIGYDEAVTCAGGICDTVRTHRLVIGNTVLPLGVSVGVAELRPGDNVDSLLARADEHMYACRAQARSAR